MNLAYLESVLVVIPLICSIIAGGFGKRLGKAGVEQLINILQTLSISLSICVFLQFVKNLNIVKIDLWNWCVIEPIWIPVQFNFGSLNISMLTLVSIIGGLVYFYSTEYMRYDPYVIKFWSYICLFQFFMFILVISDNLIMLIVGWEGIGLCSYLLIGFWFTRTAAYKAAMKAMVVNSIGDSCLLVAIALFINSYQTINFDCLIYLATNNLNLTFIPFVWDISINTLGCILLLVAVMSKSAQIGLHIWLSDAMEGPTPVSALIHAATMVTAGIFLVMRLSGLFEQCSIALSLMIWLGSITAFVAGTMALAQNDIKKIIAFSTCSQLGYMLLCCGVSNYSIAFFHLITHAFFKALLFLTAGAVIHSLGGEQDIRKMGGLAKVLPLTYIMMLVGSLALAGFPFLAGFYSKDLIIEVALSSFFIEGQWAGILALWSAFLTAFYSTRLIYHVFLSESNVPRALYNNLHEMPLTMAFPLIVLAFGSIFSGYFLRDLFIGLGSDFFMDSFFILPEKTESFRWAEFSLTSLSKVHGTILAFLGILLSLFFYSNKELRLLFITNFKLSSTYYIVYSFFANKWYFDKVYLRGIALKILKLPQLLREQSLYVLLSWMEISIQNYSFLFSKKYSFFAQNGNISNYIFLSIFIYLIYTIFIFIDFNNINLTNGFFFV